MGSVIDKIEQDRDKYWKLCQKYEEEPQYIKDFYGVDHLDCYGVHAESLKERERSTNDSNS